VSIISKLALLHEEYIAGRFMTTRNRGSGNQWNNQADGGIDRSDFEFAFRWDCKAAMPGTKSISVSREMLGKIQEQAHGARPMIPLRFYSSERGQVEHDWIAIRADDFEEMWLAATER